VIILFDLLCHWFLSKLNEEWVIQKLMWYTIKCICFRVIPTLDIVLQVKWYETAKHWDSFLSHCTYRGVCSSNFRQICRELKEIQQFETVMRNECAKPIWQSHVKNTIIYNQGTCPGHMGMVDVYAG
jgi:hypothetical protein